jgi:hypothetical protein
MWKLLIVAILASSRLDLFKDNRDPNGDNGNYLSRSLSCNFAEMMAFTPFMDPFLHLQTYLVKKFAFVSECSS